MKSLSASIVVAAGMGTFSIGGLSGGSNGGIILLVAGGVVALIGMVRWFQFTSDEPSDHYKPGIIGSEAKR